MIEKAEELPVVVEGCGSSAGSRCHAVPSLVARLGRLGSCSVTGVPTSVASASLGMGGSGSSGTSSGLAHQSVPHCSS